MSGSNSLYTYLRILVAKTHRAEKLYESLRINDIDFEHNNPSKHRNLTSSISNDIRAEQWQKQHFSLRKSINEILSLPSSEIPIKIIQLKKSFKKDEDKALFDLEKQKIVIADSIEREEFAHLANESMFAIKLKAKAQASRVIVNEISAIIDKTISKNIDFDKEVLFGNKNLEDDLDLPNEFLASKNKKSAKVIPLRRRFAN